MFRYHRRWKICFRSWSVIKTLLMKNSRHQNGSESLKETFYDVIDGWEEECLVVGGSKCVFVCFSLSRPTMIGKWPNYDDSLPRLSINLNPLSSLSPPHSCFLIHVARFWNVFRRKQFLTGRRRGERNQKRNFFCVERGTWGEQDVPLSRKETLREIESEELCQGGGGNLKSGFTASLARFPSQEPLICHLVKLSPFQITSCLDAFYDRSN